MKKIITFMFLTLLLISAKNVYATGMTPPSNDNRSIINKNNIVIDEELFLTLLDAGYTVDEVYNMTEAELENANLTPVEAMTTKYIKTTTITRGNDIISIDEEVTKEEYDNSEKEIQIRASGTSETTYKRMTATITTYNSSMMKYRNYLYWKQIPSNRSYDINAMGYESSYVKYASTINFYQMYTQNYVTTTSTGFYSKRTTTGAGASFQLPSGTITSLVSDMYIYVEKVNANITITNLVGAGDYAHATSSVTSTQAQNYTINHVNGIVLDSSISNKYDSMSPAYVYWSGTW